MRNPMWRGHGGQLERREMGSLAQAESWHGGGERWGLWPAVGEPTTSDRGWPIRLLVCPGDTMLPVVNCFCSTCGGCWLALEHWGDGGHRQPC